MSLEETCVQKDSWEEIEEVTMVEKASFSLQHSAIAPCWGTENWDSSGLPTVEYVPQCVWICSMSVLVVSLDSLLCVQ
jgi:hypothetical protein